MLQALSLAFPLSPASPVGALAYYMKENDIFPKGFRLQECLDFYFQVGCCIKGQNSILLMIKFMFADLLDGGNMRDHGGVGRDPRQRWRVSHHGRRDTQTGICQASSIWMLIT